MVKVCHFLETCNEKQNQPIWGRNGRELQLEGR